MLDIIKSTFGRLCKQTWGADLIEKYKAEAISDVRQTYSTAIAVEREEGREEGIMQGFVGEFIATGKLSQKSLKRIKQNPPDEDWISEVWKAREVEMAELESGDEEEDEVPDGRTFDDFVAYLKARGVIAAGGEED